jgi:hypothetical protein
MGSFLAVIQWIQLGQKVVQSGAAAFTAVKDALAAQGIEGDTVAIDAVIADAELRKQAADAEASATS